MIRVNELTYKSGKTHILKNLSLQLNRGGFYALMGANGSGKTTLLRCLSGMLEVERNRVFINQKDICELSAKKLAKLISIVPQRQNIEFDFTAHEIVLMGRNPYQRRLQNESDEDMTVVKAAMESTHTWELRRRLMNTLSGGEFQRVIIARAIAQQTPVILLDEPLSNLDIAHQYEILELLTSLNQTKNMTILLILHDLNMALQYCNKLILLKEGEVVFSGNTSEGFNKEMIKKVFNVRTSFIGTGQKEVILVEK